ncbi:MAG: GNAT family protein [Saprospiraceae bacterium]|nr:GNAT family protein [Saprospiraceae bacterium]
MTINSLSVRELQEHDIDRITDYWLNATPAFLEGMGVDLSKMPSREQWRAALTKQLETPIAAKQSYAIIWEIDEQAIGHCNINDIKFGEQAFMHLHMWRSDLRQQGAGVNLVKMTLPYFFENFQLKRLFCEPNALNPAPNKTLPKVGFTFVKAHLTTPSWLTSEQMVNRWEMSYEQFKIINNIIS